MVKEVPSAVPANIVNVQLPAGAGCTVGRRVEGELSAHFLCHLTNTALYLYSIDPFFALAQGLV